MDNFLADYSAMDTWLRCREEFRRRYIENLTEPIEQKLDMAFGGAIHAGIEEFWKGNFENVFKASWARWKEIDRNKITDPRNMEKFTRLSNSINECLEIYLDKHSKSWENQDIVEEEIVIPELGICGKPDHFHRGILYDTKTATDMGGDWIKQKRLEQLRSAQYSIYELLLRHKGLSVEHIVIEVLVKPKGDKKARIIPLELDELLAPSVKERFRQQLDWNLAEMRHYIENYKDVKPWPMASSQICVGKYSPCTFVNNCIEGDTEKNLVKLVPRVEHLQCRGAKQ